MWKSADFGHIFSLDDKLTIPLNDSGFLEDELMYDKYLLNKDHDCEDNNFKKINNEIFPTDKKNLEKLKI